MALLKWSNFFSVGIDDIDNQHKQMIDMINELHDGITECRGTVAVSSVLPKLLDYTREHFVFEEKYMLDTGFPEFGEHFKRHHDLTEQVEQLCDDLKAGREINQLELVIFLADWLKDHIMQEDMQYARYAVAKEAKLI